MPGLSLIQRLHFLHRAWRYRLRTEHQDIAWLLSLDLRAKTCVDVGAHRGVYSYWMRKAVGPNGRVVAFEPQPGIVDELRAMKQAFALDNLTIVESGLSESPGSAVLHRGGGRTGEASIVPQTTAEPGESFTIPITTLDDYFAANPSLGPVAFIKCDVEGHEREVFRGARRILSHDRPRLLFECLDQQVIDGGVFNDLKALGYKGWFPHKGQRIPVERWQEVRPQVARPHLNYMFEPA